jgi:RNA polymerase sigma-70 factor (ECF subfamily)
MDKQFFTSEVMSAERSLYRIARSYLPTDVDAADAVQEALTRAWEKRGTLRELQYFRTWLTRIVINVCKTVLRERRRVRPMAQVPETMPSPPPYDDYPLLHDTLQTMDLKYRIPLVLFYLDGYSLKEIAGLLLLPQGTVKNRLHRAREKLRTKLSEEVFDDEAE